MQEGAEYMELLQLRYFYESAKSENFSKTAKMFLVPTTSVSASIKRLEAELGCTLFDRTANCIRLNANGRLLQQTLCSVFGELDRTIGELSAHPEESREIKILVRAMRRQITDLIVEYNTKHPHVTFKVGQGVTCIKTCLDINAKFPSETKIDCKFKQFLNVFSFIVVVLAGNV